MIGHQAAGPDFHAGLAASLAQEIEIRLIVVVGKRTRPAAIAALGHMVRQSGDDEAGDTGHRGRLCLRSVRHDGEPRRVCRRHFCLNQAAIAA